MTKKQAEYIVGVDPSPTATAVSTPRGCHTITPVKMVPGKRAGTEKKEQLFGPERLVFIRDAVEALLLPATLVVIEGYSYGSARSTKTQMQLGELGGVLRALFYELGIPYVEVAPGTLKKFASGNGNAKKPQMHLEAVKRLGYTGHDLDQVDALWLREIGLQAYGLSSVAMPKAQVAHARKVVAWPELALKAG